MRKNFQKDKKATKGANDSKNVKSDKDAKEKKSE